MKLAIIMIMLIISIPFATATPTNVFEQKGSVLSYSGTWDSTYLVNNTFDGNLTTYGRCKGGKSDCYLTVQFSGHSTISNASFTTYNEGIWLSNIALPSSCLFTGTNANIVIWIQMLDDFNSNSCVYVSCYNFNTDAYVYVGRWNHGNEGATRIYEYGLWTGYNATDATSITDPSTNVLTLAAIVATGLVVTGMVLTAVGFSAPITAAVMTVVVIISAAALIMYYFDKLMSMILHG